MSSSCVDENALLMSEVSLEQETEAIIRKGSPKLDNWKLEKTLPSPMSLEFYCDIQMVGSEFGIKNMKAWIHPAFSQRFRLVVVV